MEPSVGEKYERVRRTLPVGRCIADGIQVVEVRRVADDAVVIVQHAKTPWRYGVPLDLADTSREYYYECPVGSFDEWLEYVDVYLMVAFDTGLTSWGARTDRDDYVELRL